MVNNYLIKMFRNGCILADVDIIYIYAYRIKRMNNTVSITLMEALRPNKCGAEEQFAEQNR